MNKKEKIKAFAQDFYVKAGVSLLFAALEWSWRRYKDAKKNK